MKKVLAAGFLAAAAGCCAGGNAGPSRLEKIKAYADAEVIIEHMRKEQEPDWAAIREQYDRCMPLVSEVDEKRGTNYIAEISQALEKCAAGDRSKVNQQILAKGLQHVTVLAIKRELDAMAAADLKGRQEAVVRAAALFEGIRPTFSRRDGDFFAGTKTLEVAADEAIAGLRKAARAASGELLAARRQLEDAVTRTYALSVLYEVQGIEKLRDKDLPKCDVKQMEAVIFYRIIQPRVERRDKKADEIISAMLKADYSAFSAEVIEKNLQKGLPHIKLR